MDYDSILQHYASPEGSWEEVDDYDYRGDYVGKVKRFVPKPIAPPPDRFSLGQKYEQEGPKGAPEIIAFLAKNEHEKIKNCDFAFVFFILQKGNVIADQSPQTYVDQRELVSNPGAYQRREQSVVRWHYVSLFNWVYDSPSKNTFQTRFNEYNTKLKISDSDTVFDPESFFYQHKDDAISYEFGRAFALIAFDFWEDVSADVFNLKYAKTNKTSGRYIVPVNLSNPRCIYVNRNIIDCKLLAGFSSFDEYTKLMHLYEEVISPDKQSEMNAMKLLLNQLQQNKQIIEIKIKQTIESRSRINLFKPKSWNESGRQNSINKYTNADYASLEQMKEQIEIVKTKIKEYMDLRMQLEQKLLRNDSPRIYIDNMSFFHTEDDIQMQFFIDPKFNKGSLIRLVYEECAKPTRGGKRNNRSQKKKKLGKNKKSRKP